MKQSTRQKQVGQTLMRMAMVIRDDPVTFDTFQNIIQLDATQVPSTAKLAFATAVLNWPPGHPVTGPELFMLGAAVAEGVVTVYLMPARTTMVSQYTHAGMKAAAEWPVVPHGADRPAAWPFPVAPLGEGKPRKL